MYFYVPNTSLKNMQTDLHLKFSRQCVQTFVGVGVGVCVSSSIFRPTITITKPKFMEENIQM